MQHPRIPVVDCSQERQVLVNQVRDAFEKVRGGQVFLF